MAFIRMMSVTWKMSRGMLCRSAKCR